MKFKKSYVAERNQEKSEIDRIRDNSKIFFKYGREKSAIKSPIGPSLAIEKYIIT